MPQIDFKAAPAAAAAGLEVVTGAVLVVAPSLVARLLFGSDLNPTGDTLARIAGLVMVCLAAGCWPRAPCPPPVAPLLALSLLAVLYLVFVGVSGAAVGVLLWPAAVTHLIIAIFLARAFLASRRAAG